MCHLSVRFTRTIEQWCGECGLPPCSDDFGQLGGELLALGTANPAAARVYRRAGYQRLAGTDGWYVNVKDDRSVSLATARGAPGDGGLSIVTLSGLPPFPGRLKSTSWTAFVPLEPPVHRGTSSGVYIGTAHQKLLFSGDIASYSPSVCGGGGCGGTPAVVGLGAGRQRLMWARRLHGCGELLSAASCLHPLGCGRNMPQAAW